MHSRREFLRAFGIAAGLLALVGVSLEAKAVVDRPNIVFIIVDDLGQYDLSCTGSSVFKTPNIDRLAAEGIRFTEAYSGCTVCAPARSTLMTGLHMGHTTVRGNTGGISLRAEDVTVAEVLKKVGYTCGGFGKWGIGDVGTPGVPEENGFDTFFGYYHQVHAHTYYPRYLWRNGEKVPLAGNERPYVEHNLKEFRQDKNHTGKQFSHHLILEEAKEFIRENKDGPFFCYCPWTPPHGTYPKVPHEPAMKDFKDKPWPEEAKVYAGMVKMIDRNVGEILALLKELNIDDRTIVFFCSDNGGLSGFKDIFHSTGPLRGNKGTFYEGGLRVPLMARYPGKIEPGRVSEHLCYFPDVMPTLAEMAGAEDHLPPDIDGLSIVPTLTGRTKDQKRHKFLYWEYPKINFATKTAIPGALNQAVRMGKWKLVRHRTDESFALYDLSRDIGEENDLAGAYPKIAARLEEYARQSHGPMPRQKEPDLPEGRRFR